MNQKYEKLKTLLKELFQLDQPEGTQLQIVGAEPEPPKPAPPPAKKGKKKR